MENSLTGNASKENKLGDDLAQALKRLAENPDFICLSTVNANGVPETRAMINLGNPTLFPDLRNFFTGDFAAYFSTNTSSEKMSQLAPGKMSSVYYFDPKTIEGLLIVGELEIVEDKKTKAGFWQEGWMMYYKGGVDDPDYTLLRLAPRSYKYYNGNFEVIAGSF